MCVRVQQPYEHVTGQCPFLCGTCTICTPVALIPLDHVQGRRPLQSLGMRPAKCFLVRRWWEFCQHSSFSSMSVAFSPTCSVLAYSNSNDCDDPTLKLIRPRGK